MVKRRLTRAERSAQTRAELMASARQLFLRRGFHASSLELVAQEAGFTIGAVYSRFGSKADLFLAILDEHIDRIVAEVGQVAGPAAGADRPSLDLRIERLGGIPERTDRAAVGEVPHACGDDAAVPRHPRHLAEACDRIVHDVDHELGERRIEAASFERQILSRRADDLDSGMAAA